MNKPTKELTVRGNDEINLAQVNMSQLSQADDARIYTSFELEGFGDSKWIVAPSSRWGTPTAWGEKLRVALMCDYIDNQCPERQNVVPYRIAQIMGVQDNKAKGDDGNAFYNRMARELRSWVGLTFYSDGMWYDAVKQELVYSEKAFHIIDDYELTYRIKDEDKKRELLKQKVHGQLKWSDQVKANIQHGYMMSFDRQLYFIDLKRKPSAAKAYLIVSVFLWREGRYTFDLQDLLLKIGLSLDAGIGQAKRNFNNRIVKPLVDLGAWERPKYYKDHGFWKFSVSAGPRTYLENQKTIDNGSSTTPDALVSENVPPNPIKSPLTDDLGNSQVKMANDQSNGVSGEYTGEVDLEVMWKDIKERLALMMTKGQMQHFQDCSLMSWQKENETLTVTIGVPNERVKQIVENRLQTHLERAFMQEGRGDAVVIQYMI